MKKFITKIAAAVLCVGLAIFPLAGCGETAYELAVQSGFVGTESEWLESLKGESAYDLAVKNGFEGTEEEWLKSLSGKDGVDGKDGLNSEDSAYEVAKKHGFEGSEEEWLESLKGADGRDGTDAVDYLYERWETWNNNGSFFGSYQEFLQTYSAAAKAYGYDDGVAAVSRALCSSVIVFGEFTMKKAVGMTYGGNVAYCDYVTVGAGAGVIYDYDETSGDAYIITNYHVVYSADSTDKHAIKLGVCLYGDYPSFNREADSTYSTVTNTTMTGGYVAATFAGGSPDYDVAVLKVNFAEGKGSHAIAEAELVDSDYVKLGQTAIAIGNPNASGFSATSGTLSVDSEYITMESVDDSSSTTRFRVMRVDTAINGGNSGGGLYDGAGRLMGIVNAKTSSSSIDNISYAIPANVARAVADNVMRHESAVATAEGRFIRRLIGVETVPSDAKNVYDEASGTITLTEKITVTAVSEGSVAANAGIAVGDVIKSVAIYSGESAKTCRGLTSLTITRGYQLSDYMLYADEGDVVKLIVERDGTETTFSLTV